MQTNDQLDLVAQCVREAVEALTVKGVAVSVADGCVYTTMGHSISQLTASKEWVLEVEGWRLLGDPGADMYPTLTHEVYRSTQLNRVIKVMLCWIMVADSLAIPTDQQNTITSIVNRYFSS